MLRVSSVERRTPRWAGRAGCGGQVYLVILLLAALFLALSWELVLSVGKSRSLLKQSSDKLTGLVLELLLYNSFPRQVLQVVGDLTKESIHLGHRLLKPALLWTIPFLLTIPVVNLTSLQRPALAGEPLVLRAGLEPGSEVPRLSVPPQLEIEINGLHLPQRGEAYWRLRPRENGVFSVKLVRDGKSADKTVIVGEAANLLAPYRSRDLLKWLSYPAEGRLANDSPAIEIAVDYPEKEIRVGRFSVHPYLILLFWFLVWNWALLLLKGAYSR